MNAVELIRKYKSGVVQILLERDRRRLGNGSAFLVSGGLVTNSHVLRTEEYDAVCIRFADNDPEDPSQFIRLLPDTVFQAIAAESPESDRDYAFLRLSEPEFEGRHRFEFGESSDVAEGEQVLFLGFPFGMAQLTAHLGYISSIHQRNNVTIIQIDGSVNGGNSGGPLIDLKTGKVVGIVTRAVTGLIAEEFENLLRTLRQNQEILQQARSIMRVGGVDPIDGLRASQAAMEQIARNLYRSANVGIGYAYVSDYVRDHITRLG